MKRCLKLVLKLLLGVIGLVILLAAAVVTVWLKPSLVLTEARVDSLFVRFAGDYFAKKPDGLRLTLDPYSLTGKRVRVEASNFCLKLPDACFKTVDVNVAFKFVSLKRIRVTEIGPITVLNEHVNYVPVQTVEQKPEPKSTSSIFDHIDIPTRVLVKDLDIEFPELNYASGSHYFSGKLALTGKESEQMSIEAQAKEKSNFEAKIEAQTAFVLNEQNHFHAKIHFKSKGSVDGEVSGKMDWAQQIGKIEGSIEIKNFVSWMNTIYIRHFRYESEPKKMQLHADLETRLEQRLNFEKQKSVMPKASIGANVQAKLEATRENGVNRYELKLGPNQDKGIVLAGDVAGVFPFPKNEEAQFGLETFLIKLEIPLFQTLVKSLYHTNFAIPAPFSVLKGRVALEVGEGNGAVKEHTVPIQFITALDSKEQAVKTESKGSISFKPAPEKISIDGETDLHEIKLTLPDIKALEPTPMIKNDPRLTHLPPEEAIAKAKAKVDAEAEKKADEADHPDTSSAVAVNWKIKTDPSGIQLHHSILKPFAPAEVTWTIGDSPGGTINLKPFEIEFMNRVAKIVELRMYENPGDPVFHYYGKLEVQKTDYTIFVEVVQDGDKPKVVMTSAPPLEQSDIISVLLFNETSAELDSDQGSSVASTQSAVASRALGLFSILTLSSTPIEAVNFNPNTHVYSARVKLANGLTATVGTDWDKTQSVALRKRLGKHWVVSTSMESDTETNIQTGARTNTQSAETLIEWFKRF